MSVTVYSTPSCVYCTLAKQYFKDHKINFTDYNVASNQAKAQEMVSKSGQMGVPVIDINGRVIVGFNKPAIESALKR